MREAASEQLQPTHLSSQVNTLPLASLGAHKARANTPLDTNSETIRLRYASRTTNINIGIYLIGACSVARQRRHVIDIASLGLSCSAGVLAASRWVPTLSVDALFGGCSER